MFHHEKLTQNTASTVKRKVSAYKAVDLDLYITGNRNPCKSAQVFSLLLCIPPYLCLCLRNDLSQQERAHTHTHVYTHTYRRTQIYMHTNTCLHTHLHTTQIHICRHAHTHTLEPLPPSLHTCSCPHPEAALPCPCHEQWPRVTTETGRFPAPGAVTISPLTPPPQFQHPHLRPFFGSARHSRLGAAPGVHSSVQRTCTVPRTPRTQASSVPEKVSSGRPGRPRRHTVVPGLGPEGSG